MYKIIVRTWIFILGTMEALKWSVWIWCQKGKEETKVTLRPKLRESFNSPLKR